MIKESNFEHSKLDDLSETIFKLIEDISEAEEKIEETKKDIASLRESIQNDIASMKDAQKSHIDSISQLNNTTTTTIQNKISKLENNINTIVGSGILEDLSSRIDNKILLKKEISKWQMIIVGILAFVAIESLVFFIFVFNSGTQGISLLAFLIAVLPFVIAMYFINNNLKKLISQEKAIPSYTRRNTQKQQATRMQINIKDNDEIKNTLE